MGRVEKYGNSSYKKRNGESMPSVKGLINHDFRVYEKSKNPDIDPEKKHLNIVLSPYKTAEEAIQRYQQLLKQAKQMKRSDIKNCFQWCIHPSNAISGNWERELVFMNVARSFFLEIYGDVEISGIIHRDENLVKGKIHLHWTGFAQKREVNKRTGKEELRVGCTKILTPEHLKNFHVMFDKFVTDPKNGGHPDFAISNSSSKGKRAVPTHAYKEIEQLKEQNRQYQQEIERLLRQYEPQRTKKQIIKLTPTQEQQQNITHEQEIEHLIKQVKEVEHTQIRKEVNYVR